MPQQAPLKSLSKAEQIILLKGSKLYEEHKFPPWDREPSPQDFQGPPFEDSFVFQLSDFQSNILQKWSKPIIDAAQWRESLHLVLDLVQDVTNDCSIVASLCVANQRASRVTNGLKNIFSSVMYPFDHPSVNGKYVIKLNFNGCARKVVIDDLLPVSSDGQYLHVTARDNADAVWPALIEKAYLKVMGGYDFPGSDSSTDLWILAGWIPERISIASGEVGPRDLWRRVKTTFDYGDVMVTIGTPRLSILEEKTYGLASGHDYAVIDMKEENDVRKFLIKNPWSHASDHLHSSNGGLGAILEDDEDNNASSTKALPGTRWMDLHEVFRLFEAAYLSWNPDIFSYRTDVHFTWQLKDRSAPGSFTENPQYCFKSRKKGIVWLLLTRHIDPVTEREVYGTSRESSDMGYISLYAFTTEDRRILSEGSTAKTSYVNSQNVLLRLDVEAESSYVVVASEQDIPNSSITFSLSAFSTIPLDHFKLAPSTYIAQVTHNAAWALSSAGGNANSPHHHLNPQFSLDVPRSTDVAVLLSTNHADVAINTKVVWAGGARIQPGLLPREVYASSGKYRRGSALAILKDVQPGKYTIVCSTFEPGQRHPFRLTVFSTKPGCTITPAAADDAGMFTHQFGPCVFRQGTDRILCPIFLAQTAKIRVRAYAMSTLKGVNSPITMSLEFGQGPNKRVLVSSGESESAISLPETLIQAKWCELLGPGVWLVVERTGGAFVEGPESFRIEALSATQDFKAGDWGKESEVPIEELRGDMDALHVSKSR